MKGITLIIAGDIGISTAVFALEERFRKAGYEDIQIISAGEVLERGITIDKPYPTKPIPFKITPIDLDHYFNPSPRKNKNKGWTEQHWRTHRKK